MCSRLRKPTTLLLLTVLFLGLGRAQRAEAHAAFVRAEPPPNSLLPEHVHEVTIWFSEPLEPQFSEIQVLDSEGQRVDSGNSRVLDGDPMAMSVSLPTLPDGTYTVAWRNVSTVDGHSLRGSYVFSFGQAMTGAGAEVATTAAKGAPLEPLARGLALLGALTIAGGLFFERLLIIPVFFHSGASGFRIAPGLGRRLQRRTRHLIWLALLVFGLASVYQLAAQAATLFNVALSDVQGLYMNVVLRTTDWGRLWLWRIWLFSIIAVYMAATALIAAPEDAGIEEEDIVGRAARALALLTALGLLLVISLTSHAAAMGELRAAALFSDYLHLVASAVWVGGLFHLALAARPVFALDPERRGVLLSDLIPRFSTLALLSVGTLVITGLYSAWAQVTTLPALVTPYGLTLLAKLGLFVPLLALGAINLLRLSPQLRREDRAGARLRRTVSLEALLAVAIILVVGLLTGLEPARQVAARQGIGQERTLTFEENAEGTHMRLAIEPALTGSNELRVQLHDAQGRPITNASQVHLELTYLNTDLGPMTAMAQPADEPGDYVVQDALFSVAGDWQAALLVQRPDAFDARSAFRFDVQGGQALDMPVQTGYVLWGIELVLLGALFAGVSLPLGGWRTRPGLTLAAPGALALVAGLVLAFGAPHFASGADETPVNPFPPTAESIAAGDATYVQHCQACHGASGLGDGPAGAGLDPPPADLVYHVPLHPDSELFMAIDEGKAGTAMPAFSDQLSEEQIWHLVNYLRTLAEDP